MFGYLIDMDGVIYRGSQLLPGAEPFIRELRRLDVPFRFLTYTYYAFPMMLVSIAISHVYVWWRYF